VVDKKNQIYALNTKIQVNTSSDGLYRVYHQEIKANMKTHLYTFFIFVESSIQIQFNEYKSKWSTREEHQKWNKNWKKNKRSSKFLFQKSNC